MGSIVTTGLMGVVLVLILILFLNALGNILVEKELVTRDASRRGIISIVLFAVIFYCADFVLQMPPYDINIEAIKFFSAVIGAGCYWIGSRR